jgi:hypothetical protein
MANPSTLRGTLGVIRKRIQQIRVRKESVGELRQIFLQRGN